MFPIIRIFLQQEPSGFVRAHLGTYDGQPPLEAVFPLPYNESSIHHHLEEISSVIREEGYPSKIQEIGETLYQALFSNEGFSSRLKSALAIGETAKSEVHLQLAFNAHREDSILRSYPWELLCDQFGYLQAGRRVVVSRYLNFDSPLRAISIEGSVRVLILSPISQDSNEAQTIEHTLQKAGNTGRISVDRFKSREFQEFVGYIISHQGGTCPHVIHFDGHGDYGWLCPNFKCREFTPWPARTCKVCGRDLSGDPMGYLVFYDKNGEKDYIDARTFASQLVKSDVQLVNLSACSTAYIASRTGLSSVAECLISAGIPAVVAMQFPIPFRTALVFMKAFYLSLTQFDPLGEAMGRARTAVFNDIWFPPVLHLREKDDTGQLFTGKVLADQLLRAKTLYGRDVQLMELTHQVLAPNARGVLVWGMGGSGKSAFVAESAIRLAWRFEDGVIWVEAEKEGVEDLVSSIGERIVGLDLSQLSSTTARINKLIEAFKKGKYLLIIDGLEVMLRDDVKREEVSHFLTHVSETTKLIITSREVLELDNIHSYELPDIDPQAALSIFKDNIEIKRRSEVNADQIAYRIVDYLLGCHPLAIEIAARLTRRPDMTIAALEKRLESGRLSLLNDPAWANRPEKLRDVQVSIDLSFQELNERERLAFTQLAVLQNPWDEATGIAVTELGKNEWLQIHNALFDMSLLRIQQGKYVFHPLIKEFGYAHLSDKVTTHLRAANYLSRSRNPIDRAEAYDHAMRAQDFKLAKNILLKVYNDMRAKGRYAQLLSMISEALNTQPSQDYRFHLLQAELLRLLGSIDKALKRLQWMLQRLSLQPAERVLVLNEHARILKELDRPGDIDQAIRDHNECLKICDALTGKEGIDEMWLHTTRANVLHDLGMLFHYYKKTSSALMFAEELYTISAITWHNMAKIDNNCKVNEALSLKQLAELTAWPGNPKRNIEEARLRFEKAIEIFRDASAEHYLADTLFQVAKLNQYIGQFDIALSQFEECESLYRRSGLEPEVAIMVKQQGEIFQDRTDGKRNISKALDLFSRALQDLPNYQDKWSRRCTVKALYRRGEAYLEVGRPSEARDDFFNGTNLALNIEQGSESERKQIVRSFCALTNAYRMTDNPVFPISLLDKVRPIFESYDYDLSMNSWREVDCRNILEEPESKWFHHNFRHLA